ncbi:MAG: C4-type zinc ribbon domain-containing protein [Thermodesulfobacteriota bacterium]
MNQDMINLVKLQKLDLRLAQLLKLENEAPERMAQVEAELLAAEQKVDESLAREKEMSKRRRELEMEISVTDDKVKNNQARQLQAKNNDEYRALLKEADYLRKTNSAREDEVLALMESLEALTVENARLKTWLAEQRQTAQRKKKEIEDRLELNRVDRLDLEDERAGLTAALPENFINLYDRLYSKRNGRAVVAIKNGICLECHLQIPPQSYNELQRNESLMTCPNCLRIVYWQDHQDFIDL